MPQQDVLFRQEVPPPFVRNSLTIDKLQQYWNIKQYNIHTTMEWNVCSFEHRAIGHKSNTGMGSSQQ